MVSRGRARQGGSQISDLLGSFLLLIKNLHHPPLTFALIRLHTLAFAFASYTLNCKILWDPVFEEKKSALNPFEGQQLDC